jgi:hypothetical protein
MDYGQSYEKNIMSCKFYYSGPLLYHTELNKIDLENIKKICIKDKTKDNRKNLTGHLENEYKIDIEKFNKTIKNYLTEYNEVFNHWYNKKIKKFETLSVWVNFMKHGEYNPAHTHSECDLTCVLYLDIPSKLKEENKKYLGTIKGGGPGSINFTHYLGNDPLKISNNTFFPNTADFFIFPATLLHSVAPFKSKIERISVSANFKIEME